MAPVSPNTGDVDSSARNPFELTSSFYGPGVVGCWYLVLISLVISSHSSRQPKLEVSNDLIGAAIYAAIAAGDILVKFTTYPNEQFMFSMTILFHEVAEIEKAMNKGWPDFEKMQHALAIAAPFRNRDIRNPKPQYWSA
ncbi:hypothetical protein BFJ68_g17387 [Fusarium oxysporum]|uniref:Uncharacterized protein n=1 Tax=Fusarium oxysporum TaxID=5507 RepID=A0A420NV15_FUSOX|nr:hypothetical protein BFJ71_g16031 [Fusarium oxysporum]RKK84104.1 hypothetical protein BFJ68_g17387 [Fusarium oxysporum]